MNKQTLAVADEIANVVKDYCARETAPLRQHLAQLDARLDSLPTPERGEKGEKGDPGESVIGPRGEQGERGEKGESGERGEKGEIGERGESGPQGERGEKGEPGERGPEGPIGQPGTMGMQGEPGPAGKDADPALIERLVSEAVGKIPPPKDGKDADMDALRQSALGEVRRIVEDELREAVAKLPAPRDGKDADYAVVRGHVLEIVHQAVAALPPAKDGRDAADLEILPSIDETKRYRRGTWASHGGGLLRAARQTDPLEGSTVIDAGWVVVVEGISALVITQGEDLRTVEVASMLTSGTKVVSSFALPMVLDRGIYRAETRYAKGDGVTWGGSFWIAQADEPTDKPGISTQWRLAVKQGERGKSARDDSEPKRETVKVK